MFNNFISIKEIFNMAEETGFIKFKKILIKLFSGKEERIKITWQNCNENKKEWWAIPTVKKRWNYLISGDENIDYNQYVLKKYLSKKDNLKALSFGCGAGQRELKWAETGKFKKIDAFDLSEKRIKYAREQAKKVGLQNITNFETDDVYNIPIREDYYDVVLGEQSLHHFSPLRKIFLIINKFLKADGLFVVNEFVGPNRFQWTDRQIEVTNALLTILPKKYKLKYNNNHIKRKIYRPSILRMIMSDPSEAVESSNILPLLDENFEIIDLKEYGGTILSLLFSEIAQNFKSDEKCVNQFLKIYFEIEDMLLKTGEINSDYIFAVCKKRNIQ